MSRQQLAFMSQETKQNRQSLRREVDKIQKDMLENEELFNTRKFKELQYSTNNVMIDFSKRKIFLPAFMTLNFKNITELQIQNIAAKGNMQLYLKVFYGSLDELITRPNYYQQKDSLPLPEKIIEALSNQIILNFHKDNSIRLSPQNDEDDDDQNKKFIISTHSTIKKLIKFIVSGQFSLRLDSDIAMSPFQIINGILQVTIQPITLKNENGKPWTISFNLMDHLYQKCKISFTSWTQYGNYDLAQQKMSAFYTNYRVSSAQWFDLNSEQRLNRVNKIKENEQRLKKMIQAKQQQYILAIKDKYQAIIANKQCSTCLELIQNTPYFKQTTLDYTGIQIKYKKSSLEQTTQQMSRAQLNNTQGQLVDNNKNHGLNSNNFKLQAGKLQVRLSLQDIQNESPQIIQILTNCKHLKENKHEERSCFGRICEKVTGYFKSIIQSVSIGQDSNISFKKFEPFHYAYFNIPLYKYPSSSLITIFLPMWLLAIVNLGVFFQPNKLSDRVACIAALTLAYAAMFPVIRAQIPPVPEILLVEFLVYFLISTTMLALIDSWLVKDYVRDDGKPYNIVWTQNGLYLTSIAIIIITFIIVMVLYLLHRFKWEPSYNLNYTKSRIFFIRKRWLSLQCDIYFNEQYEMKRIGKQGFITLEQKAGKQKKVSPNKRS